MSIGAVKHFIAAQVPSVSLTGLIWTQLVGYSQPPKKPVRAGKIAYLVVADDIPAREARLSSPRGLAEKETVYDAAALLYATHSTAQDGGDHFDALMQRVRATFAGVAAGNPTITDPITGDTSYLLDFGETTRIRPLPRFTTALLGRIAFRAVLTLELHEYATG